MQPPSPNDNCNREDIDLEETPASSPTSHQKLSPTSNVEMHQASPTWKSDYRNSYAE